MKTSKVRFACLITGLALLAPGWARAADTSAPAPAGLKWHPGHYVLFWDSPTDELLERTVFASPYLTGAQIVYRWDKLEPEKGRYDFSAIERDVARLRKHGKFLWAQIQRQWSGSPPAYLQPYVEKRTKMYAILEMPVMEAYAKLFQELGRRFDREPGFAAINCTETNGEPKKPDGEEEFMRAWTYFVQNCRQTFPHTVVIAYITWGPGKEKVRRMLPDYGVGVGGPDTVPNEQIAPYLPGPPPQGSNPEHNSAPLYTEHDYLKGKVPIGMAVQRSELSVWHHRHGTFTLEQLYEMGVHRLGANYLSWAYEKRSDEIRHDFVEDIMPFLAAKKGAINTAIPAALGPTAHSK